MSASSVVGRARCEWRRFRDDAPGRRFRNYRSRLHQNASRGLRVFGLVCGFLLVAAGIAMCFLPGPGLLVLFLGLAMFAGESRRLARWLDRMEPASRRRAAAARRWWRGMPRPGKAVLILVAISAIGLAILGWWSWFGP